MAIHRSTHDRWLTREQATARLGVKAKTLYTYASRGWIRSRKSSGRSKEYAAADVEALKVRADAHTGHGARAANALRWGEAVLTTAISGIDPDGPYYRGVPALDLVDTPFERVCALLWQEEGRLPDVQAPMAQSLRDVRAIVDHHDGDAWSLVATVRAAARVPAEAECALVLVAEHGLNASAFAARVVASTGAGLRPALIAALAAFEGPRHGTASVALDERLHEPFSEPCPGFGHPLYPGGDPRGEALLARFPPTGALDDRIAEASTRGVHPNVDAGLLALAEQLGEPVERVPLWFAAGRIAGWIAHAREQAERPELLRPRARYEGWL